MANFNFNKVILGGRLTSDPELKTTQSGVNVTSFRLAVNRRGKDGSECDFFSVTAWRKTAEFVTQYFRKGSSICVVGSLQNREYEKDGNKRTVTEVQADEAFFVDSKAESTGGGSYNPYAATAQTAPSYPPLTELGPEDEMPF